MYFVILVEVSGVNFWLNLSDFLKCNLSFERRQLTVITRKVLIFTSSRWCPLIYKKINTKKNIKNCLSTLVYFIDIKSWVLHFFFVRVCLSVLIVSRHVILSCEKNTIEILGVKHNCRRWVALGTNKRTQPCYKQLKENNFLQIVKLSFTKNACDTFKLPFHTFQCRNLK